MKEEVSYYSSGSKISALLGCPEGFRSGVKYPAIVINHGYSGNKEEYNDMAGELNKNGFVTLQFDSRGCGSTQGVRGRMMCNTEWLEDAECAVTYISSLDFVDQERIGFTGCSMGGAITLYIAALDSRIKCAVAMAPLSDGKEQLEKLWIERKGRGAWESFLNEIEQDMKKVVLHNSSRYVSVPYALCMLRKDEIDFHKARDEDPNLVRDVPLESVRSFLKVKPIEYCQKIDIPIMFIHGDADTIVPMDHSVRMYDLVKCKKEIKIIKGAPHPLPTSDYKEEVFKHAVEWFVQNI